MTHRMDDIADSLLQRIQGRVAQNEMMSLHTSWRVGGPADLLVEPVSCDELITVVAMLREAAIPFYVVGYGSNLLVSDAGVRGAIIKTSNLNGLEINENTVSAEAGISLAKFVRTVSAAGLAGVENLVAIPGTVGGAIVMNAGAMGQEIGTSVEDVTLLRAGNSLTLKRDALGFRYRDSDIKTDDVVLSVRFQFDPADKGELELAITKALDHRREAQSVGAASAGSVFKNPTDAQAWRLIDQAGLRGHTIGGATISEQHTNFIVNSGDAIADDIKQLIDLVRSEVVKSSGVALSTEVHFLGFGSTFDHSEYSETGNNGGRV